MTCVRELGLLAMSRCEYDRAKRYLTESCALAEAGDSPATVYSGRIRLGIIARLEGDYARARTVLEECLAVFRALGSKRLTVVTLTSLGNLARCEGKIDQAWRLLTDALAQTQQAGYCPGWEILACVGGLGVLAITEGTFARGVRLLGAVTAADGTLGAPHLPELRFDADTALACARAVLADAEYVHAWATGQAMTLEQASASALAGPSEPPSAINTRSQSQPA
jgi:hypothetical protein